MKAIFSCFCVYILLSTCVVGQSVSRAVIAAQGEASTSPTMSLEWTLGESFVETGLVDHWMLTQGFHQFSLPIDNVYPEWSPLYPAEAKPDEADSRFEIRTFPNPFHNELTLELLQGFTDEQDYRVQFVNLSGMVVHSVNIPAGNQQITFTGLDLPAAMYTISVQGARDGKFSSCQIVKSE